jgi:ribulose-phosphate 3-epimerase
VAGSAVFGGDVPAERIASLRDAASAHTHAHR